MKKLYLWYFITVFAVVCGADNTDDEDWEKYKKEFGRSYGRAEEPQRKAYFLQTKRLIEEHNHSESTWTMAHNEFSDMSDRERRLRLGGAGYPVLKPRDEFELTDFDLPPLTQRATMPRYLDYRNHTCMQPIRDQGNQLREQSLHQCLKYLGSGPCGSCWAFAAITPVEFQMCKKTGYPVALSDQQLVDCDSRSYGCGGGWFHWSWAGYLRMYGTMLNKHYPYTSGLTNKPGACSYNPSAVAVKVIGYAGPPNTDASSIAEALLKHGPLATAMVIRDNFFFYSGGIYDDPTCNAYRMNHAVVLVGYGEQRVGHGRDGSIPYWIVRNTWSTKWGENGYFRIRRGINACFIEYFARFPILDRD